MSSEPCLICGGTAHAHSSELGKKYVRMHCGRCGSCHFERRLRSGYLSDRERERIVEAFGKLNRLSKEVVITGIRGGIKFSSMDIKPELESGRDSD